MRLYEIHRITNSIAGFTNRVNGILVRSRINVFLI